MSNDVERQHGGNVDVEPDDELELPDLSPQARKALEGIIDKLMTIMALEEAGVKIDEY